MPRIMVPAQYAVRPPSRGHFLPTAALGNCLDLASSSSRVTFTVPAALDPASIPAFTFAVWMFPRLIDNVARRIIDPNGATGAGIQIFQSAQAGVVVRVKHSVQNAEQDSFPGTLPLSQWSRVLFTWDDADPAGLPKLYINAVQFAIGPAPIAQLPKIGVRAHWSGSTAVLGNTIGNSAAFNGQLDRISLWPRVLTPTEIADDYYKTALAASATLLWECEDAPGSGIVLGTGTSGTNGTATNVTQGVLGYVYATSPHPR